MIRFGHISATPSVISDAVGVLSYLISKAAQQLSAATGAAEILEARDTAGMAYDTAKRAARFARAKQAHDDVIAAVYRAQADALAIESIAKRRLAHEYDAAQERGEVGKQTGRPKVVPQENDFRSASAADLGLSRKEIHEARQVRDAEEADPGIVRRVLDEKIAAGQEPTKAAVREAVVEIVGPRRKSSAHGSRSDDRSQTKAGTAWANLCDSCRELLEWASEENILLAMRGKFEQTDDQSANLIAVRKCADRLNDIAAGF